MKKTISENMMLDLKGLPSFELYSPWQTVLRSIMKSSRNLEGGPCVKTKILKQQTSNTNHSYQLLKVNLKRSRQRRKSFNEGITSKKILRIDNLYPKTCIAFQENLRRIKQQRRQAIRLKLRSFIRNQMLLKSTTTFWKSFSQRNLVKQGSLNGVPKRGAFLVPNRRSTETSIGLQSPRNLLFQQKLNEIVETARKNLNTSCESLPNDSRTERDSKHTQKYAILEMHRFKPNPNLVLYQTRKSSQLPPVTQLESKKLVLSTYKKIPTRLSSNGHSRQSSNSNVYLTFSTSQKTSPNIMRKKLL